MKFAAGVLVLLIALRSEPARLEAAPPPDPADQDWLADPVLPACLTEGARWPDEALTLDLPPLSALVPRRPQEPSAEESTFPRAISGSEIQAWREERDLLNLRRWSSEA